MGRGHVTFELSSDMVGRCAHGSGGRGIGVHIAHGVGWGVGVNSRLAMYGESLAAPVNQTGTTGTVS